MRGGLQPSAAQMIGAGTRWLAAAAIGCAAIVACGSGFAAEVSASPTPTPSPSPSPSPVPVPSPTASNATLATDQTVLDLGSSFLARLGNQATNGAGRGLRTNPGGGGASEAAEASQFRTWGEAYGIWARTSAQGSFVGDTRTTAGGVAGIGARLGPGVNVGISVDQSRTGVDVPLALQSASLDLTQIGFNASVDRGPWTWAVALVHGVGDINSRRDTSLGAATAGYGAHLTGVLTELDYYWTFEQSRIVPKLALEYARATSSAFQETGGLDPLAASRTSLERARVLVGAEIGHYVLIDGRLLDLSAYGKFVDNFSQNLGLLTVSLGTQSIALQGLGEGRYGADAGAAASLSLSNTARLYLNYDAKFRAALQSHQGTFGVEVSW
ncbi:autotransporter outer membrane beta-barrel domain-containing protein [Bradyrhizobium sp. HKCCYLS1011]|uniref:autotransporter outer membrane beta-barrel domain-containing protein n=1 Tax=Bradyrhizobium sp. HKCCYLS1011 TaxID=3420733 RepID=UPI003EBD3A5B